MRTALLSLVYVAAALLFAGTAPALPPAPEGTFTYAVFSDTHGYAGGGEDGMPLTNTPLFAQTAWLASNIEPQRIVFVSHAGDLVNNNTAAHYPLARQALEPLHGRVPYAIAPGNHDMTREGDPSRFQKVFGEERFKGFPWYGGARENNAGSWQVFSGGGLDFVIVHLACNAKDDALAWADGVLERNRPRMAIVVTHAYLGPVEAWNRVGAEGPGMGRMCWSKISGGNTPEQMWEKCFSKHEHLFLIVSGDQAPVVALRQVSQGANGNVVHEVMANYPILKDTDDWLRLYRFDVPARKLRALTYSPAQDRLCTGLLYLPWKDAHQFDLDISDAIGRFEARK